MKLSQVSFPYPTVPASGGLVNPNTTDLGAIVTALLPYLFAGAGLILLLNLLFGGISLMLSRGDPKAIEGAKGRITSSVIGFIIVFVAYWIVQIVGTVLKLQFLK